MIENRAEQKEALEALAKFNGRLIGNMKTLAGELSGSRKKDTGDFLKDVIQSLNWEIQVVNGTMELLNEDKERIDKSSFNKRITALSEAISEGNDAKMAEGFRQVIPAFEELETALGEVVGR